MEEKCNINKQYSKRVSLLENIMVMYPFEVVAMNLTPTCQMCDYFQHCPDVHIQ